MFGALFLKIECLALCFYFCCSIVIIIRNQLQLTWKMLVSITLVTGIRKGRGGLGAIFVWATGNGGHYDDYCSCDGYITSIFTVSIGAVNDRGKSPWYAEPCPSTLAVTYSSGETQGRQDKQIVTTDLHHSCTKSHTGTSAAAPLAAGLSFSSFILS